MRRSAEVLVPSGASGLAAATLVSNGHAGHAHSSLLLASSSSSSGGTLT